MKINNKQEKELFFQQNIKEIGSYALVTYDNKTEVIWISKFDNFNYGGDWFLESPCNLHEYQYDLNNINDLNVVKEQGYLIKNDKVYEIDSPQTGPFLPDILDDIVLISEDECLEWILKLNK